MLALIKDIFQKITNSSKMFQHVTIYNTEIYTQSAATDYVSQAAILQ